VAKPDWSDDGVLTAVRGQVLLAIEQHGPRRTLIVHNTGFPKKGCLSVGAARQYCRQLGKQENCPVAANPS
jgi:SRSO17 transposase